MRGATNDKSTMRFSGGGPEDTLPITTSVPPSGTSLTTPLNHPDMVADFRCRANKPIWCVKSYRLPIG